MGGRSVPQRRVDWCSPCAFCTKSHHERATMTHLQCYEGRRWSEKWAMGEHNDFFVGACGSLWMSVMDVEYQNACFKVEHDLFCTKTVPGFMCCPRFPGSRIPGAELLVKNNKNQRS